MDLQPKFCMYICLLILSSTAFLTSITVSLRVHIMVLFTMQLACNMTNMNSKRNHKTRPGRDKLCFILNQGDEVPKQSSHQVSMFSNLTVLRKKIKSEFEQFSILLYVCSYLFGCRAGIGTTWVAKTMRLMILGHRQKCWNQCPKSLRLLLMMSTNLQQRGNETVQWCKLQTGSKTLPSILHILQDQLSINL
jgi:hypothetical protein